MRPRQCRSSAAAKINTCLEIIEQRSDGFHELETVYQEISLCDQLLISEQPEQCNTVITYANADLSFGEQDICWRAVEMLRPHASQMPGISVAIEKHIPVGAGLGGASSDAACILRTLADWYGIDSTICTACALALGSDVAFFLAGGRAYARGRGELLSPLPPMEQTACFLLLPEQPLATAAVFAALTQEERGPRAARGPEACRDLLFNRMTAAARRLSPELETMFQAAAMHNVAIHLSGSGSACFSFDPACQNLPVSRILTVEFVRH